MPRKINFFDGFTSSTEPTLGNIKATGLVPYPDDAAYEAVEVGSPDGCNAYYNTTTGRIRYYDDVADAWKDSDDRSFERILIIEGEQVVQNQRLDDIESDVNQVQADISIIQSEQITQDAAIALNTAKISFDEAPMDGNIYARNGLTGQWEIAGGASNNSRLIGDSDISLTNVDIVPFEIFNSYDTYLSNPPTNSVAQICGPVNGANWHALDFTTTAVQTEIKTIEVLLAAFSGQDTIDINAHAILSIYPDDGFGLPDTSGSPLFQSDSINVYQDVSGGSVESIFTFTFPTNSISPSTQYHATIDYDIVPFNASTNRFRIKSDSNGDTEVTGQAASFDGTNWSLEAFESVYVVNVIDSSLIPGLNLNIDQDIYYQVEGFQDNRNTIVAQDIVLAEDGDVAYFIINQDTDATTINTVTVDNIDDLLEDTDRVIFARRKGTKLIFGTTETIIMEDGDSFNICENVGGSGSGAFTIKTAMTGSISGNNGSVSGTTANVANFQNVSSVGDMDDMGTYDAVTGIFTISKTGVYIASGTGNSSSSTSGAVVRINGVEVARENGTNNSFDTSATWSGLLVNGDTISFGSSNTGMNNYQMSISGIVSEEKTFTGAEETLTTSYSTSEHTTGETWIDGRTVYRRVLNFDNNVTTNTSIATWAVGLEFIDSFRRLNNDEWVIDFFNGSGTSNRFFLVYNEVTGDIGTQGISGSGQIEAGTNFVIKYVK